MSDGAQVLGWTVDGQEAPGVAARVLAWLVAHGVVEALPTDSGLSILAHRPGPRALEAVDAQEPGVFDFRKLATNGVELNMTARQPTQMPSFVRRVDAIGYSTSCAE